MSTNSSESGDSDQRENTPPRKLTKRACVFKNDFLTDSEFKSWILKDNDVYSAKCKVCKSSFSIKSGGRSDLKRHAATVKHQTNYRAFTSNKTLDSFSNASTNDYDYSAICEASIVYHSIMHHHSYLSQDCTIDLINKLNKGLKKNIPVLHCGRTKATAIAENVLAPLAMELFLEDLTQDHPYSLCFDASNKGEIFFIIFRNMYLHFEWIG